MRQQRDALLTEYKTQLSVSTQLIPRLEALTPPDDGARHTRLAALNAWRRNVRRAERRRDALNTVVTIADLRRAASIPDRGAIEDDGGRLTRRLLQLAPEQCEFSVAPAAPLITLPALPGSQGQDVTPTSPVPAPQPDGNGTDTPDTPNAVPEVAPDVAPKQPDVAPSGGGGAISEGGGDGAVSGGD